MLTLGNNLQAGDRSRCCLTMPYDSTQGVGAGFYWFSGAFLRFIVFGVLKLGGMIENGQDATTHYRTEKVKKRRDH
jgi:hypothetical protein